MRPPHFASLANAYQQNNIVSGRPLCVCRQRKREIFWCNFWSAKILRHHSRISEFYISHLEDAHGRGIGRRRAGFPCQIVEARRGFGDRQPNLLVTCKYTFIYLPVHTRVGRRAAAYLALSNGASVRAWNNAMSIVALLSRSSTPRRRAIPIMMHESRQRLLIFIDACFYSALYMTFCIAYINYMRLFSIVSYELIASFHRLSFA